MTKQQINRLAEAYADAIVPNPKTYDDYALWGEYYIKAHQVLAKLSDKFLVVAKDEVLEAYNNAVSDCLSNDFAVSQAGYAYKDAIETLFPDTFNPTEK